jgi:hypothetical protein
MAISGEIFRRCWDTGLFQVLPELMEQAGFIFNMNRTPEGESGVSLQDDVSSYLVPIDVGRQDNDAAV